MLILILPVLLQQASLGIPAAALPPAASTAGELATARAAIASGRLEEASTLLMLFDAQHPDEDGEALALAKGELALERGSLDEAERLVEQVAATGDLRCGIERIRGLGLAQRGYDDAAIVTLGDVVERCAPDWRVWRALGSMLAARGDAEASRFAFAHAQQAAPGRIAISRDFARALVTLGDVIGASETLQAALRDAPQDGETRRLLDYVGGLRGFEPERATGDTNDEWAQRLVAAAQGARQADLPDLARALVGQALLVSPRYDRQLLAEARQP